MQVRKLKLKETSKLMDDYINQFERLSSFFVYDYHKIDAYKDRLRHLNERTYDRERLAEYLYGFNKKYQPHDKVFENIKRLKDKNAVVVVAGQQAGLFTGPAYTIHKCLSILKLTEKLEKELSVPVVPVFWIAGEDHDFAEVNHIHILDNGQPRKHKYNLAGAGEDSVSRLQLDHGKLEQWIKDAFRSFGETQYTKSLLNGLLKKAAASSTLVDFFAAMIHEYFGSYGLVLMDSGDPELRKIESDYFEKMIEHNAAISESVVRQLTALKDNGYAVSLDQKITSANLFYHHNGERILLERADHETFMNAVKGITVTREDLIRVAQETPEKLSNNVVTRPLMQESLLPTIAFIGGPGEVAYWSALKGAFEKMGMIMPPVLPRIRITMVDEKTKNWLAEKELQIDDCMTGDWSRIREAWLNNQHEWDVESTFTRVQKEVINAIQPLHDLAREVNPVFDSLCDKNKQYISEQLAFMKKAIEREFKLRYQVELNKFDRVKAAIAPGGQLQERTWSIVYFLNYWGPGLITSLMASEQYTFDGDPLLVEL
ncbi:MAG: bacillithiol biosynthesis cysteine-adding enzyme BshC [Tuberibacillus sp.]